MAEVDGDVGTAAEVLNKIEEEGDPLADATVCSLPSSVSIRSSVPLGAVLHRDVDIDGIPRSFETHKTSSRSTTPTLRRESLGSVPSQILVNPEEGSVPIDAGIISIASSDGEVDAVPILARRCSIETPLEHVDSDTVAMGSAFFTSFSPVDYLPANSVRNIQQPGQRHLATLDESGLPPKPSSILTTSSGAGINGEHIVDCVAALAEEKRASFTSLLDTGSSNNFMSEEIPRRMDLKVENMPPSQSHRQVVIGLNGPTPIVGICPVEFIIPGRMKYWVKVNFKVVPETDAFESLLCHHFMEVHGLSKSSANQEQLSPR